MPMSEELKRTIWAAVRNIEARLAPTTYPQRFPTINDAKLYVQKICEASNFDYGLKTHYNLRPTDPHNTVRIVKDRSCFLVAVRAHSQGEFYLEKGLPDRQSLRDAIEADIVRVLAMQHTWPAVFVNADVAAKFVAGVCAMQDFKYTCFEGVAEEKFRAYVCWNTARHAWEGRQFELQDAPKEWKRKEKKFYATLANMTDAIEADIARLSSLIQRSSWPSTFTDLNAARNFVGQWCYDYRFRYTGWPDVELRKYRLFVNFNAAKYALEAGYFRVERAVPPLQSSKKSIVPEIGGTAERQDDVKVLMVDAPVGAEDRVGRVDDHVDCTEDVERMNNLGTDRLETSLSTLCSSTETSSLESSSESGHDIGNGDLTLSPLCCSTDPAGSDDGPSTKAAAKLEKKKAAPVDPFKDLVAELQRGYLLRATVN